MQKLRCFLSLTNDSYGTPKQLRISLCFVHSDRLLATISSPCIVKNFLYFLGSTQPSIQWLPGIKGPVREADPLISI
jgi:hypothetical protein